MTDSRETWYDESARVAVTLVDVTSAAQALVNGHLSGPTAGRVLTEALAAAALIGAEMSEEDEVLSIQMKCSGALGGYNVECTAAGTLRGYTERKTLDDFDGLGRPDFAKLLGDVRLQVTRSVPGRILSQGLATSFDAYLADSLQRRARLFVAAEVSDEAKVLVARGALVEALPDSSADVAALAPGNLAVTSRTILKRLGLTHAILKKTEPLAFGCRCSGERAASMLAMLTPEERRTLPPVIDVTCHMCGRTFSVATGGSGEAAAS